MRESGWARRGSPSCTSLQHPAPEDPCRRPITKSHCRNLQRPAAGAGRRQPRGAAVQASTIASTSARAVTTASGSPSVWPTCSGGMALWGTWMARNPALLGAPDVVEEPVADVDAPGGVGGADRGHGGLEGQGRGLGPRDLAGVDVTVDQVEHPVAAEDPLVHRARPDRVGQDPHRDPALVEGLPQRPHMRVGEGVRLPELVVGGEQVGIVTQTGLGEQVGDGRALLVVAAAPPHRRAGLVEPLAGDLARRGRRRRPPAPGPWTRRGSRRRATA